MKKKFDLSERLIEFAAQIIDIAEGLPQTFAGKHLAGQLIRSGTSPALQYAEAQSAESRNDFIHKLKVAAKELRESFNCLCLIQKKQWYEEKILNSVLNENDQLIAIMVKSIITTQRNLNKEHNS